MPTMTSPRPSAATGPLAGMTPFVTALALFIGASATLAGAWIFEWAGYAPCDLCLKQRWPYYAAIPLALAAMLAAWKGPPALTRGLLLLVAAIFAASAVFGAYHSGVEWGFWPGPAGCAGTIVRAESMEVFLQQMQTATVVRCDEAAIRILGLSLAGWNAIVSAGLSALAIRPLIADKVDPR